MSERPELEGLIDSEALARWMDDAQLPGAGEPLAISPIGGGASNEIFSLQRSQRKMVLRRPPRKVPKGRNQTMLREYRVLRALRDSDVPHARVHGVCEDESIIGACFYLMDHVDGWSPMQMLGTWPAPFDQGPKAQLLSEKSPAGACGLVARARQASSPTVPNRRSLSASSFTVSGVFRRSCCQQGSRWSPSAGFLTYPCLSRDVSQKDPFSRRHPARLSSAKLRRSPPLTCPGGFGQDVSVTSTDRN